MIIWLAHDTLKHDAGRRDVPKAEFRRCPIVLWKLDRSSPYDFLSQMNAYSFSHQNWISFDLHPLAFQRYSLWPETSIALLISMHRRGESKKTTALTNRTRFTYACCLRVSRYAPVHMESLVSRMLHLSQTRSHTLGPSYFYLGRSQIYFWSSQFYLGPSQFYWSLPKST